MRTSRNVLPDQIKLKRRVFLIFILQKNETKEKITARKHFLFNIFIYQMKRTENQMSSFMEAWSEVIFNLFLLGFYTSTDQARTVNGPRPSPTNPWKP